MVAEKGTVLGWVTEYRIDPVTGAVGALEVASSKHTPFLDGVGLLESDFIRIIGKEVVVVSDEAETHLKALSSGIKEKALHTWEVVRNKGQIWGRVLGKRIKSRRSSPSRTVLSEENQCGTLSQSNSLDTDKSS